MIKLSSTEMASRVIDRALQIHGAAGYSKDLIIEQFYRAIRAVRIFEGPNEVPRWRLARNMLHD
jgi:alkylation response protein AidB-like acyl-CoA dehydrogenase